MASPYLNILMLIQSTLNILNFKLVSIAMLLIETGSLTTKSNDNIEAQLRC